jgi:hypothetical protein
MTEIPEGYVVGLGRDVPHPKLSHLYKGSFDDPGWPMCRYGWNRDEGTSYSIWRGNFGDGGVCRICQRRAAAGLDPVPPRSQLVSEMPIECALRAAKE